MSGGRHRRRLLPKATLLAVVLAGLGVYFLYGHQYLDGPTLAAHRDLLVAYTRQHYWPMLLATAAVYLAATALSIPGGPLRSLATGFLFGPWVGGGVVIVSATAGATLAFLGARYLFAEAVQRRLGTRGARLVSGFAANGFRYLLFLRLVPLFPFWLVNLAPGVTPLPTRTFVAATALGIAPASFVMTSLGRFLAGPHPIDDLEYFENMMRGSPITIAAIICGVLALVSVHLTAQRRAKRTSPRDVD